MVLECRWSVDAALLEGTRRPKSPDNHARLLCHALHSLQALHVVRLFNLTTTTLHAFPVSHSCRAYHVAMLFVLVMPVLQDLA